jgi:hypothetical protein
MAADKIYANNQIKGVSPAAQSMLKKLKHIPAVWLARDKW